MARRGENIYKRKDGRWEGRIPNGYYHNGRKKYYSVYAGSYAGVKTKMREIGVREKAEVSQEQAVKEKALYMKDIFRIWTEDKKYQWKPSTYACYVQLLQKQIIPDIGGIPVLEFNSSDLNQFLMEKRTKEALSDTYIQNMTNLIFQALRHMKEVYQYNIIVPSGAPRRLTCTEKQLPDRQAMTVLEQYLTAHAEESTCLGILLCCYTGLRIGELCALQWKDIDLERGVLHIYKTMQRVTVYEDGESCSKIMITVPKTKRSIRNIPISPMLLKLLHIYRKNEGSYLIQGSKTYYAEPRTVQYRFQNILKQCGIASFNFHMLRHFFATRCIMQGFDLNSLSELLGHSSVQVTLNRYVHSSDERKRYLIDQFVL